MATHYELIKVFCDGGSRGNPGPAASGVIFTTKSNRVINTFNRYIGHTTNNQAEYDAMILALEKLADYSFDRVEFYLDSELVVKQIKGEYRVKNAQIIPLHQKIKVALAKYDYTLTHVRREDNRLADKAVNDCLDSRSKPRQ